MKPLSDRPLTAHVGIDWADAKHDAGLQAADREQRASLPQTKHFLRLAITAKKLGRVGLSISDNLAAPHSPRNEPDSFKPLTDGPDMQPEPHLSALPFTLMPQWALTSCHQTHCGPRKSYLPTQRTTPQPGTEYDGFLHLIPLGAHCVLSRWHPAVPFPNLAP